jgi:uncharacterized repeat protein (TIGR03806 family)
MRAALLGAILVAAAACGSDGGGEETPDGGSGAPPYALLSQYGFFKGDGHTQEPVAGVVPFEVNSPLFADFAAKHRFIVLPPGGKITYNAGQAWTFPEGTFIVKTFYYADRLIETRVLIKQASGWLPTTYLWNDAQTEAMLQLIGSRVRVTVVDDLGASSSLEYRDPNQNQCYGCHGSPSATNVLGLKTRQLNRTFDYGSGPENQIDHMIGLGMFDGAVGGPETRSALDDPYGTGGTVETRARAWLDANCAHCHNPAGAAGSTNLYLNVGTTNPLDFGVCRTPNAAGAGAGGRRFVIVPGKPDESIMTFRIASTEPGIKMPEMPIQLVDHRGVDLITAWIASLPATPCNPH